MEPHYLLYKSVDYKQNNLNQIAKKSEDGWKTQSDFTYDRRGNLIQEVYTKNNKVDVKGSYTYDETNKMVLGVNEQGESSAYLYNGLGALVENTWVIKKNAYGYHDVSDLTTIVEGEAVVDNQTGKKDKNNKNNKNNLEPVAVSPEMNKNSTVVKQFVVDYTSETFEPLMEYEVNGLGYRYLYGNDRLSVNITGVDNGAGNLIENGNQIRLYYHMDYLGTADYLTSPVSLKVESWTHYNEWGEITHNAVLKCGQRELDLVKRYATHDYDNVLGMYYAKARFYDGDIRRLTAIDPILDGSVYDITDYAKYPELLVQYLYVKNNPIIYIDPDGLRYVIDDLDIHGINAAREKERQKKIQEEKLFDYMYNRLGYNDIFLKGIAPSTTIPEIDLAPKRNYSNYIKKCDDKNNSTSDDGTGNGVKLNNQSIDGISHYDGYYIGVIDEDTNYNGYLIIGGPATSKGMYLETQGPSVSFFNKGWGTSDGSKIKKDTSLISVGLGSAEIGLIDQELDYEYGGMNIGALKANAVLELSTSDGIDLGAKASLIDGGVNAKIPIPYIDKKIILGVEGNLFSAGAEFKLNRHEGFKIGVSALVGGAISINIK